ncbi:peptide chain release factor 1 [Candidatus Uhrbacteria bacterium]|jgi:peptide chain release factor 1|nr:peptide chain release factor 1 [Candidatus Uhrbacteria bacterium]
MNLLTQFNAHKTRLKELESSLMDPELLSDTKKLRELNEAYAAERAIVEIGERYEKASTDLEGARSTLVEAEDDEMKELAQEEIDELEKTIPALEQELTFALIPPDPMDKKNIIVEIRAGAGGDEASLFAAELMRMYQLFAEGQGWKMELIGASRNDVGGFKEVSFGIKGSNVFSNLKFESGVHRVQRVPETEKQGRIHTSTITVAVLPEAEEVDVQLDMKDLTIEATTSTGAGGQSVNTTYSAIRIIHIPTGMIVYCQEERSQKQNKERALSIMRARIYDMEREKARKEREDARRGQIGTGSRSEKIRTYNFPQDRITDHRIKKSYHNIAGVLTGELQPLIDDLKGAEMEEKLSEIN